MMVCKLPKSICAEIKRLERDSIWGHDSGSQKMHLGSWKQKKKDKQSSGLGILNLECMNEACLSKLAWRVRMNHSDMWVECLKHKYNKGQAIVEPCVPRDASPLWKDLIDV